MCVFCFFVIFLSGCKDDNPNPISMEYFEQQVTDEAGTQAIDCGKVDINESSLAVNTCVSDSYILNIPFYSFYIVEGVDSTVAYAVTMSASGVLLYWTYDNYLGGNVSSIVCENPSATSELTGEHTDVFNCTE
jgi:hypothetical protein